MNSLDVINSMQVIESSASSGELEYVLIENSDVSFEKLKKLGVTSVEINEYVSDDGETIDISSLAFMYTDAKWFDESKGGFLNYIPEDAPEWAKK